MAVRCNPLLGACSPAPCGRISAGVEATDHERARGLAEVEDAVWEAAKQRAPNLAMNQRVGLGMLLEALQHGFERFDEATSEVITSLRILRPSVLEVGERLRGKTDGHPSGSSRDRASDQGMAASGSSACTLRRRSSS